MEIQICCLKIKQTRHTINIQKPSNSLEVVDSNARATFKLTEVYNSHTISELPEKQINAFHFESIRQHILILPKRDGITSHKRPQKIGLIHFVHEAFTLTAVNYNFTRTRNDIITTFCYAFLIAGIQKRNDTILSH